mgnify:CR=1 FL=1
MLSGPEEVSAIRRSLDGGDAGENDRTVLGGPSFVEEMRAQLAREGRALDEDGDAFAPQSDMREAVDGDDVLLDAGDAEEPPRQDPLADPVIAAILAADGSDALPARSIHSRADDVFGSNVPFTLHDAPAGEVEKPRPLPPSPPRRGAPPAPGRGAPPPSDNARTVLGEVPEDLRRGGPTLVNAPALEDDDDPPPRPPPPKTRLTPTPPPRVPTGAGSRGGGSGPKALPDVLKPGAVTPPIRTHKVGGSAGKLLLAVPDGAAILLERQSLGTGTVLLLGMDPQARMAVEVSVEGYLPWRSMVSLGGKPTGQIKVELRRPGK